MPDITLQYFDFPGRGTELRLLFFIGGTQFTDQRLTKEEFIQKKEAGEFPFGQVPVLIVNGKKICQTHAIANYAARLGGLVPKDPVKAALVDQFYVSTGEMVELLAPSLREQDPERKKAMRIEFKSQHLPKYLSAFERWSRENAGKYYTGDELTLADIKLYLLLKRFLTGDIDHIGSEDVEKYEQLLAVKSVIDEHPKVKEFFETQKP